MQLVDFVSILAAIVIFGNIFSVLVFKVKLFPYFEIVALSQNTLQSIDLRNTC